LFFIDHLSLHGIEKALDFFQTKSDGVNAHVFSPNEFQEYNRYEAIKDRLNLKLI
jgi:hypothetical protein